MGAPSSLTADERQYVADLAEHVIGETERDGETPWVALRDFANGRDRDQSWSLLALAQEVRRLRGLVDALACPRCVQENDYCSECLAEINEST